MKHSLSRLVLLAILFTLTISAPLERSHGRLHRLSPHRGVPRRIQAALAKRPLNLTFIPINTGDVPVHVEHGASTQLRTTDFRFSATLLKLGRNDDMADAKRPSGGDAQVAIHPVDTYGGRHVVISAPELVVRALQQRGISQDDMPRYVRQNMHVADPDTGNQYQLVPGSNPEGLASIDSSTIMIVLTSGDQ